MYGKSVVFRSLPLTRLCSVRHFKNGSSKKLLEFLANMPKANPGRIAEAQRQRVNIQKKSEKYGSSTVYLQVLGSGAPGVPNTLYLFTDQKRYLFNCGECTQRLAHEHKVKLSRLEHIFITSKSWRNIGGLPGLSLTLQDVGVPNITLHGPEGLEELYNATRRFVIMKDMNITKATCNSSADFKDNVMTVKYILLSPEEDFLMKDPAAKKPKLGSSPDREFQQFMHDDTDYYKRDPAPKKPASPKPKESWSPTRARGGNSEKFLQELRKMNNCTVAYVCTLNKRLGALDLAKCVERGVKPGPLLGQLKSGQDVVLPDGTLVRSKDVKTPDDHGPMFIVLEVPELSYLNEAEFEPHFAEGNPPTSVPAVVVHYTPPRVLNDPRYQLFMLRFGPECQHLVLNSQNSCLGSEAVHRTQHKMHLLEPEIFPLLRDVSMPAVWGSVAGREGAPLVVRGVEELKTKIALAQFQNIVAMEAPPPPRPALPAPPACDSPRAASQPGRTNTVLHLRPQIQLDRSAEPKLNIQEYIQETLDVDGFSDSLERFRKTVDELRGARRGTEANKYPKVVFLGTGSCIPSKTRNTSAIVLQIDEGRSMLLDCGEGTYGQLVRFYGPKRVGAFLRTLHAVYVSHLHADHHIGLIGVLQARAQALQEYSSSEPAPVYLLAPGQIMSWLSVYHQQFEPVLNTVALVPNQGLLHEAPTQANALTPAILACLGLREVQTCLVSHCPNAFGVALVIDDQHKVTYSGDTIPCEELVKIGKNSTLLIHEATMEDELADEARIKMHSTTSQAIAQGELMSAKYTVLTHFSQRYARLPRLSQHILTNNSSVGIAFDNMQITFPDLSVLPLMYAPLQLMFAEHCVGMEAKAAARGRRRARSPDQGTPRNGSSSPVRNTRSPMTDAPYIETHTSKLPHELHGMPKSVCLRIPRSVSSTPYRDPAESSGYLKRRRREALGFCSVNATPRTRSPEVSAHRDVDVEDQPVKKSPRKNTTPPVTTEHSPPSPENEGSRDLDELQAMDAEIDSVCKQRFESIKKGSKIPTPVKKNVGGIRPISARERGYLYTQDRGYGSFSRERCVDYNRNLEVNTVTVRRSSKVTDLTKIDVVLCGFVHLVLWRSLSVVVLLRTCECECLLTIVVFATGVLFWTATKCIDYGSKSSRGSRLYSNMEMEIVNPMWNKSMLAQRR